MDPMSIVGLSASCGSLLTLIVKAKTALGALHEKAKTATVSVASLVTQLSALEASTAELESILRRQETSLSRQSRLATALSELLSACDNVIGYLFSQVCEVSNAMEEGNGLGWWTRTKYALDESALAPMKEALRDQVQAIQLFAIRSCFARSNENEQDETLSEDSNVAIFKKASDDSSSLLWLRDSDSRLSFASASTDSLSRVRMIFGFDGLLLDSKPYRTAVKESWKRLRVRQRGRPGTPPAVPRPRSAAPSLSIHEQAALRPGKAVAMIVEWDFHAERGDELECKTGEVLVPIAISDVDDDWVIAKPVARLGGPGLVPVSFLRVVARSGTTCKVKDEILHELRDSGVPGVREWKKAHGKYVSGMLSWPT